MKAEGNKHRENVELGDLQLKFFPLSTLLPKPNITSLKDLIDIEG